MVSIALLLPIVTVVLTMSAGQGAVTLPPSGQEHSPHLVLPLKRTQPTSGCATYPCVVATVPVGVDPWGVAYDGGKGEVFVANWNDSNTVSVVSDTSNTVVTTIVGSGWYPESVAYDGGKGEVFVGDFGSGTVDVISDATDTVVATVNLGGFAGFPVGVAYDGGMGEVFATNDGSNSVSVISDATNKVVASIPVGGPGVAYDSGKGEVFATNGNSVSVISDATNKVVASVGVGTSPVSLAYDSGKGEVFVANRGMNSVDVISDATNSIVKGIIVGSSPDAMAYDSGTGEVFVANNGSNTVSVISDSTDNVVATLPVGLGPDGVAYDSGTGEVFVANSYSDNLSVIADGTRPAISSFTASPPSLLAGEWTNLTVAANGGQGTLTYSYTGLPSGCASKNVSTLPCRPTTAGNYTVRVFANNSYGSASATTTLNVTAWLTSVSISPTSITIQNGTAAVFSTFPVCSGGSCPAGTSYAWSLNNSLVTLNITTGTSVKATAVANSGSTKLTLVATLGSHTVTNSSTITLVPGPGPLVANVTLSAYSVHPGTKVWINATASGGKEPYGYVWTLNSTLSLGSGSTVAYTPRGAGNYTFSVNVSDSVGQWTTQRVVLRVLPPGVYLPLTVALSANTTRVHVGARVALTGSASGGLAPYTYVWSLNGVNESSLGILPTQNLQFSNPGNYTYRLWVTDSKGDVAVSNPVTIEVSPVSTQTQTGPSATAFPLWALLAIVVLVAALLLFLVVVIIVVPRRRKRNSHTEREGLDQEALPGESLSSDSGAWQFEQPQPDYFSGVTFPQPPPEWQVDPTAAYGTYQAPAPPPPAPEPDRQSHAFPSEKLNPDAYRSWALRVTPEGIAVEEIGHQKEAAPVRDAEFTTIDASVATTSPGPQRGVPSTEDAYMLLYVIAQRPRSLDAIKQVVNLPDDSLASLLRALEKASMIVTGTNSTTRIRVYAITPVGRHFLQSALGEASNAVPPSEALPPARSASASKGGPPPSPQPRPSRPVEGVEMDGLRPEDVNPQARAVPKGSYQAWSADVVGGSANIHEIGGEGAKREAAERERIRRLLEYRENQRRQRGP